MQGCTHMAKAVTDDMWAEMQVVRPEDAAASAELAARLELYAPATRRLAQLEVDAQTSFWNLKRKFADAG